LTARGKGVETPVERTEKQNVIEGLRAELATSQVAVLCDFRGMKVAEVNQLRAELFKSGVEYKVVKNTLARIAMDGTPMLKALQPFLEGPTAIAYSREDPTAPARVLTKMAKEIQALKVKAGYLDGRALNPKDVESLASMPGKAELRARLLGLFSAPASGFVRVLSGVPAQFARLLEARRKQLEGANE
jgi:large subunit ribosomal protein L10